MSEAATQSRSLWADALRRFRANKMAMGGVLVLALITLICLTGPLLAPNAYDRVYPDYVRAEPGFAPYPRAAQIGPAAEKIVARMRASIADSALNSDVLTLHLTSARAIDPRLIAYFERSGLFGPARITQTLDEGKTLTVEVPVKRVTFLFGTDANGRDLFSRTLIAGRVSLAVGLLASLVALVIGVFWGALAGYAGGRTDLVMMRVVDILYALPFIFFVILLVVMFGRNFFLIFVAIGAIEWLDMARIVRGQTMALKRQEFVGAAEALGASTGAILVRHIIPNTLGPVAVYLTLLVPKVILLESFLSFLGLGIQEPMTSWGALISEGARNIQGAAYTLVFPALFLTATLFALNFTGDGLRDALDPRER